MSVIQEKAQGRTKQIVGQMIGDDLLIKEGEEQERKAAAPAGDTRAEAHPAEPSALHPSSKRDGH